MRACIDVTCLELGSTFDAIFILIDRLLIVLRRTNRVNDVEGFLKTVVAALAISSLDIECRFFELFILS